jgi:hypothetical protein
MTTCPLQRQQVLLLIPEPLLLVLHMQWASAHVHDDFSLQ